MKWTNETEQHALRTNTPRAGEPCYEPYSPAPDDWWRVAIMYAVVGIIALCVIYAALVALPVIGAWVRGWGA